METSKKLPSEQQERIINILKTRFEKNMQRHDGFDWSKVEAKLRSQPEKLWSLNEMEETGGEPDVVGYDQQNNVYEFYDCSAESPAGRRSCCYDQEALDARKEHKPKYSAIGLAKEMGIEIITEEQYRKLQELGNFDLKTSSWVKTPVEIRELGGAIFCDKRYKTVFMYHNGAESYYAVRAFRAFLKV